jgi:hypothetical protein
MTNNELKQMYEKMATDNQHEHMKHSRQQNNQEPISNQYNVNLHFDSIVPEAGRKIMLTISVAEKSGTPIKDFEVIHDKLLHLIIVGEDLSYFAHVHPTLTGADGNFTIAHIFPESGTYKLWVDFKPKGGKQTLVPFIADVKGLPTHKPIMLVHDGVYVKESLDRNYQISLKLPQGKIVSKEDTDIVFSISDASGNPITDLEPLMGAGGHSVIIGSDLQEFLHVHPAEEVKPGWKGGPHISFRTSFPKPGLYKAWGQFQHKGKIITADFVLEVA